MEFKILTVLLILTFLFSVFYALEAIFNHLTKSKPDTFPCYQCEKEVNYLFPDSRCKDCTRITPDELTGADNA